MPDHKAVYITPPHPPTAQEAVKAIYGMSIHDLVVAILENKDGKYDRLYKVESTHTKGARL